MALLPAQLQPSCTRAWVRDFGFLVPSSASMGPRMINLSLAPPLRSQPEDQPIRTCEE
ncbi:hypothetical protein Mapa_008243 [Marchantia paleacea]|nr:hypothetical protein Mapa_008243 [Marchantia paleacea]